MPSSLGPAEILVILVVALIVLGPSKLPGAARQVGKTLAEIRRWSQGFQDEIRSVIDPGDAAPSYPPTHPPPAGATPETPPPVGPPLPGPATPADAEYPGTLPDAEPPGAGKVPPSSNGSGHAGTNGSRSGPAAPEPSEPPAGEPPTA